MKITSLTIQNYRGVRDVHLTPGNAMLMLGLNGQGKSTILQSVNVLLFGGALDARGNRILVADLIGPHGNEAGIAATIETPAGTVRAAARITAKGVKIDFLDAKGVGLYSPNAEAARIAFWAACGLDAERAAVACNPRAFLMAGMGGVLSKLDAGGLDAGILRDECGEHWEFVERLANAHRTGLSCIQQLEELGKFAYTERAATNKVLKDAEKRAALAKEKAGEVEYDPQGLETAHRTMRQLETEALDLANALGRAQAQTEAAAKLPDLDELKAEAEALEATVKVARETARTLDASKKKAEDLIIGRESAVKASAHFVTMTEAQLAEAKRRAEVAEKGKCPTCGAEQKKADLEAAGKAVRAIEADLIKVQSSHAEVEKALEEAKASAANARNAVIEHNTALNRDAMRLETLKQKIAAPRPVAVDPTEIEEKISAVQARIARGRAIIAQGEAAREAETHANEVEAYRTEVAELDWVVKAFKDGNVTKQFAGDGLETFVQEASERLADFGYGLSVRIEGKTTDVIVIRPDGVTVPYQWASKGERVLCEWAVSCIAPAAVTCLDDLDALSGSFKQIVIPQIASRTEGTTLAASTWGMPSVPDCAAYSEGMGIPVVWIEQGAADAQERAA